MSTVYDAGFLIAADRGDRVAWAKHALRLQRREIPLITAPVVAQVARSARQAHLYRLLRGCEVVGFTPEDAPHVGALLAKSGTSDVVDAHLVTVAHRFRYPVATSDVGNLQQLAVHVTPPVPVISVG